MSKSKETEPLYSREMLIKSKALREYQQDFMTVILTEPYYTMSDAKAAIEAVLHGERKE